MSFDELFRKILGPNSKLGRYYEGTPWFRRFVKYGVSTTLIFWLVRAPLMAIIDGLIPDVNLVFFVIPSYLWSAFIVGLILTLVGFLLSEGWIWKKQK